MRDFRHFSFKYCISTFGGCRSSCPRKFLPVTGNFFLRQEISSCGTKFLPVTGSFFLWQEISSCHRKFVPEIGNFFLWHEVSYPKFLSDAGYFSNISSLGYKIATKAHDFWSYLKIATKVRDFCSKLCLRVQGFLARFLQPCPGKSHSAKMIRADQDHSVFISVLIATPKFISPFSTLCL